MTEKTCKTCIHFDACSKWTDFPSQCGVPVCAKFKEQSEWISVSERLPEPHKDVMTYDGFFMNVDFIYNDGTWSKQQRTIIRPITHWMPLPDAPKNP